MQIAGPKALSIDMVHNAQGWWRNGRKMDADSVESLLSGFRDLAATRFATSGFTTPVMVRHRDFEPRKARGKEWK